MGKLLEVKGLRTNFYTYRGVVKALNGVDFTIHDNEVVGLVGETGSGKSVTAKSIMRLIDSPGKIMEGEVLFNGVDLLKLNEAEMRRIRGNEITMIFQDPVIALNPVLNIEIQMVEAIETNLGYDRKEAKAEALDLLRRVGLPDLESLLKRYPHELSGGMAQRVFIAMSIAARPKLLIADEPTSSLDVTIQSQILGLLRHLMEIDSINAVLFITHDLGVAAELCDKIAVMYGGRIMEFGKKEEIFEDPRHPYTRGLLKAVPKPGFYGELFTIPGEVPDLVTPPPGCVFHPRCLERLSVCDKEEPETKEVSETHFVSCHLMEDD